MKLSLHIDFNGQCREAFSYYAQLFNGIVGVMLAYKDTPAGAHVDSVWGDKIVHANVAFQGIEISGADVKSDQYNRPAGFYLLMNLSSEEEVHSAFLALAANGAVILRPQKTFWSPCYAIVIDQFGVPWKLNCGN